MFGSFPAEQKGLVVSIILSLDKAPYMNIGKDLEHREHKDVNIGGGRS